LCVRSKEKMTSWSSNRVDYWVGDESLRMHNLVTKERQA
jgi:hypothetical protein